MNIKHPESWDDSLIAGTRWYDNFIKNHPNILIVRSVQNDLKHADSLCKQDIVPFIWNLQQIFTHITNKESIWCMHEFVFPSLPSKIGEFFALKDVRHYRSDKIHSAERGTMITAIWCCNAAGGSMEPVFSYPHEDIQPGDHYSELMQQTEFTKFMELFVRKTNPKTNPTILLLNSSQLPADAVEIAHENNVKLISFPECNHITQPLEAITCRTLTKYYKHKCESWSKKHNDKVIEIHDIESIVWPLLYHTAKSPVISSGFKTVGIYPLNPNKFADMHFVQALLKSGNDTAISLPTQQSKEKQEHINITTSNEQTSMEI